LIDRSYIFGVTIMPLKEFNDLFDGTARPNWAEAVTVEYETVAIRLAYSDVRNSNALNDESRIDRPIKVSGFIVPVSTAGRTTPNVPARNLQGRPEDRGHVMALSLGGPNDELNMVPQPRTLNQSLEDGYFETNRKDQLTWRALEIFGAVVASQLMEPPRTRDGIKTIIDDFCREGGVHTLMWSTSGGVRELRYMGNVVHLLDSNDGRLQSPPLAKVFFEAEVTYSTDRDNDPKAATIKLSVDYSAARTPLIERTYEWTFQAADYETVTRVEERAAQKRREEKEAKEYISERLRQRDDPMSDDSWPS
jgi:hypothetical protein